MVDAIEMTPVQYAEHRGVSRQAIHKAMAAGKIPFRERGGKKIIDAAEADLALGASTERIDVEDEDEVDDRPPARFAESSGLTKAKTATEVYKARLAELEYLQKVGRLVPSADVEAAAIRCNATAREIVHQVRQWADPLASAAAREGVEGVRSELRKLERDMLTQFGEAFAGLATAALAPKGAEDEEVA